MVEPARFLADRAEHVALWSLMRPLYGAILFSIIASVVPVFIVLKILEKFRESEVIGQPLSFPNAVVTGLQRAVRCDTNPGFAAR